MLIRHVTSRHVILIEGLHWMQLSRLKQWQNPSQSVDPHICLLYVDVDEVTRITSSTMCLAKIGLRPEMLRCAICQDCHTPRTDLCCLPCGGRVMDQVNFVFLSVCCPRFSCTDTAITREDRWSKALIPANDQLEKCARVCESFCSDATSRGLERQCLKVRKKSKEISERKQTHACSD